MHSFVIHQDTTSDHAALEYNRHMKIEGSEETIIETRKWENVNSELININIINDGNYIKAHEENDPNALTEYIIYQINSNLDAQAPLKKINISQIERNKYSKELVSLINHKNELYKKYKNENKIEDKMFQRFVNM